jgi:septal ring factor EnvC (AmiA/AmiB activator)
MESELLLSKNKILNLEGSNKQVHQELAKLREELKAAREAQQTAENALVAKEAEHKKQIIAANKKLDDNLAAIATSIKEFSMSIYGKSAKLSNFFQILKEQN